MNNWKKCKLGDAPLEFIDGDRGKNYPKQNEFYSNEYCLFLSTKNVRENGFDFSECQFITKEKDEILKKGKLKINDLVLTTRGTIGNLALYKENTPYKNIRINSGMLIIRPNNEELDSRYAFYLFKNLKDEFDNFVSGSAQPQLPIRDLREVEITLPPLEEQRQIAAILSSIDDKIELLHEQNKTLEELAQTLFRHYFIENPNPSWQEKPLSEIARFLNGLACQKYPPKNFLDKLPVLKIKELSDGAIGKNSDYASSEIADDYIVNSGDVIFSWSATLMVKIWGGEKSVLNQHLFKVNSDKYPKWFFYYWTKHHLREFITISQAHATTMGHIKRKDLDNAMCKIPKDEYLKKCDLEISPKIKKIENNLNQIRTLENMRDILIPKLLNGEIKINN